MNQDNRFDTHPRAGSGCDSCRHSNFNQDGVTCHHPQRPEVLKTTVVAWFRGCQQHEEAA